MDAKQGRASRLTQLQRMAHKSTTGAINDAIGRCLSPEGLGASAIPSPGASASRISRSGQ